jgi:hypothetical protein
VFLKTAVLLGLPTALVLGGAFESLIGGFGEPLYRGVTTGDLLAGIIAVSFAYWATIEIVAVRLHGASALTRGRPRATLGRIGVLVLWTAGTFAFVARYLVRLAVAGWDPSDPVAAATAALLIAAVCGFVFLTVRSACRGYRAAEQ